MDAAVSAKNYAAAEQYRVHLKELAEEKALAIEKEQHSNNPSSPIDPVAKVGRLFHPGPAHWLPWLPWLH